MGKRFQRRIEDFTCGHCGAAVEGDGFTNHCPRCLWSRHVDLQPGDRAADCGGLMEPVAVESQRSGHVLTHRCTRCGAQKRNRSSSRDDFVALLALARQRSLPG